MIGTSTGADTCRVDIAPEQVNQRLDAVLAAASGLSRSRIQQLLKDGCIDGPMQRPSAKVQFGETYLIRLPAAEPLGLQAESIDLDILYEDDQLIIVNKPAGMVVHPAHGHDSGTLVHALLHHCPNLPGINGVERPGIVHRLDKNTSGSIVIAKTEAAHRKLTAMFAEHDLKRQYLAWCRGEPRWQQKRIELPIGRHSQHRQKMAVQARGKEAITDAEVEKRYGPFCRMRLTLHTGRTHQIRVHLAHEKLPILGDSVYARSYNPGRDVPQEVREAIATLDRQALHAEVLGFHHPATGDWLEVRAPLPRELQRLSTALEECYD